MKSLIGAVAIALLLVGCHDEKQYDMGDYLFESAQIEFDSSDASSTETGREAFQKQLVSVLNQDGKEIYFSVMPKEIISYGFGEKQHVSISEGRVKLKDTWYTIKPDGANTLRLMSDKEMQCALFTCQITITLKKVAADSPELRARQAQNAKAVLVSQKKLADEHDEFMRIPMSDFPGPLFSPAKGFTLKLPWRLQNEVRQDGISEGYHQQIDRLKIEHVNRAFFADRRENVEAFVRESDDENADDRGEGTSVQHADIARDEGPLVWTLYDNAPELRLQFIVCDGKKESIDLTRWLAAQKAVVYRSQNGAVYYDENDNLQVIYLQYDEATQRYFIGLGKATSVAAAGRAFAILRTIDVRYRGKAIITLDELTLPQTQQETRYQTTPGNLVDIKAIHEKLQAVMAYQLKKPFRFMDMGLSSVHIEFTSASQSRYMDIAFDTRPVQELIAQAQRQHPEGKVTGDLFIYGDGYNYYRDTGKGMTMVFIVPGNLGNLVERIMLLPVLQQFDMSALPEIPASERKNLLKYGSTHYRAGEPDDRVFQLSEGIIDQQGNLIIPGTADGEYSYIGGSSRIITLRHTSTTDIPEGYIFDEKGKLLVRIKTIDKLIDNRVLIAGDGKKKGLYDLKGLRWLATPRWDAIQWKKGLFIATDHNPKDGPLIKRIEGHTLLDIDGKVLASGQSIEFVPDTDYLTVTSKKEGVSLINRQGRVLFSLPGQAIERIPEINAYVVTISSPGSRDQLLGLFSERGETILPIKYGEVRVVGDYLKMWMPDRETVVWFSLEQVKNWRKYQPLNDVPSPQ